MTGLLASLKCEGEVNLIIGSSGVAFNRIKAVLEVDAKPILITRMEADEFPPYVRDLIADGSLKTIHSDYDESYLTTLGREETDKIVDKVFVALPYSQLELKKQIYKSCRKLRIPINTADSPGLCSFTLLSTYTSGDFQLGVTTSGKGCKLAARIKRELASSLPPNIDEICNRVGEVRRAIQLEDEYDLSKRDIHLHEVGEHDDDAVHNSKLNALIEEFNMTKEQKRAQRLRWLSQIVEYYPLKKLGNLSVEDLTSSYKKENCDSEGLIKESSPKENKKGSIALVGSGPGSVSLLTLGALHMIYSADIILADKLVPEKVLELVPKTTELFIARKFPGNAEKAQEELLSKGLKGLQEGKFVVRLKQGDPYIFGRGGEEYIFFKDHGFVPIVLPGLTSSLAAPVLSQITPTQREIADQVLICTGTGRRGALPNIPDFVKTRTTVFLMALHRISELIHELIDNRNWDPELPVAVVERASCPDQRVIRTNLKNVVEAIEACGSRPPGLLVTGYGCSVLKAASSKEKWQVEEGCDISSEIQLDKLPALQM